VTHPDTIVKFPAKAPKELKTGYAVSISWRRSFLMENHLFD
jgi:hypothetical protein